MKWSRLGSVDKQDSNLKFSWRNRMSPLTSRVSEAGVLTGIRNGHLQDTI